MFIREGTPSGFKMISIDLAVGQVRHIGFRNDFRDDAFVSVAAGHFIADLQFALGGDIDFHLADNAWIELGIPFAHELDFGLVLRLRESASRYRIRAGVS